MQMCRCAQVSFGMFSLGEKAHAWSRRPRAGSGSLGWSYAGARAFQARRRVDRYDQGGELGSGSRFDWTSLSSTRGAISLTFGFRATARFPGHLQASTSDCSGRGAARCVLVPRQRVHVFGGSGVPGGGYVAGRGSAGRHGLQRALHPCRRALSRLSGVEWLSPYRSSRRSEQTGAGVAASWYCWPCFPAPPLAHQRPQHQPQQHLLWRQLLYAHGRPPATVRRAPK